MRYVFAPADGLHCSVVDVPIFVEPFAGATRTGARGGPGGRAEGIDQLPPPLVVLRTVAWIPVANPTDEFLNATAYKLAVTPVGCVIHDTPALVVWMIVPPVPTAHPVEL